MRDVRRRLGQQWCVLRHQRRALDVGMRGQCAQAQHAALQRDATQGLQRADVDQQPGF